jgi:hypothetical protein
LIIKHLGHNRPVRELGQIALTDRLPFRSFIHGGLVPAILISTGIHAVIVLLFWYGCRGDTREDRSRVQIIDTRVKGSGFQVDVCLRLIDLPSSESPKQRKGAPPKVARAPDTRWQSEDVKAVSNNSLAKRNSSVAGVESSKLQPPHVEATFGSPNGSTSKSALASLTGLGHLPSGTDESFGIESGTVRFFQIAARAKSFVYVIDRSVSMGPNGKLNRAKEELRRNLEQLPADARFQFIMFNRSVEVLTADQNSGLLIATLENKQRAARFLQSILPEGGTRPVPALKRALAMKPEVIYFLSDAEDMNGRDVREVTLLNHGHSVIHVLAIEDANSALQQSSLQILAQNNRGECRVVSGTFEQARSLSGN